MFDIPPSLMKRFSNGFLFSIYSSRTDPKYLIKILLSNSLKFKQMPLNNVCSFENSHDLICGELCTDKADAYIRVQEKCPIFRQSIP